MAKIGARVKVFILNLLLVRKELLLCLLQLLILLFEKLVLLLKFLDFLLSLFTCLQILLLKLVISLDLVNQLRVQSLSFSGQVLNVLVPVLYESSQLLRLI